MKQVFVLLIIFMSFTALISCEKDAGKLPNIAFITTAGYTSTDVTVAKNTAVKMGITASKAETKDVLKTFDCSESLDGGTATSISSETLSGSNADNYTKDLVITTRNVAGTQKYSFTVVNKDGLKNTVTVNLTVN